MPLDSYFKILEGKLAPRFRSSAMIPTGMDAGGAALLDLEELYRIHGELVEPFEESANPDVPEYFPRNEISLLELKAIIANRILGECILCENRCRVDRMSGKRGRCKVGVESFYASEFIHVGEEPELVPSHTVFFTGCTFRCIYCQNWDIANTENDGPAAMDQGTLADESLVDRIMTREKMARNLNVVGGNPDQHMTTILGMLLKLDKRGYRRPIVWNSNNYLSNEALDLLTGIADLHLADFKYGNSECAEELSGIKNYWKIITRNLKIERDVADILIRHLVLPGHVECCTVKIVEWCRDNIPHARFNLMFQYHPENKAFDHPVINRYLTKREMDRAMVLKNEAGLV